MLFHTSSGLMFYVSFRFRSCSFNLALNPLASPERSQCRNGFPWGEESSSITLHNGGLTAALAVVVVGTDGAGINRTRGVAPPASTIQSGPPPLVTRRAVVPVVEPRMASTWLGAQEQCNFVAAAAPVRSMRSTSPAWLAATTQRPLEVISSATGEAIAPAGDKHRRSRRGADMGDGGQRAGSAVGDDQLIAAGDELHPAESLGRGDLRSRALSRESNYRCATLAGACGKSHGTRVAGRAT